MNNTESTTIRDIITKIPITLYFDEKPDRQHALSYVQWLYSNVPESKNVNQDKFFRETIARELRIKSMKIIEIEILIMVALDKITLDDFTLDSDSLIKKVIAQNPDKYDLDMMYRVMAQIMTKLPRDLREQVTGKHKLQVFQKVAKFINMEPKLLEKFMSMDTSLNTPVSMDLDSGDYNTLNKKYLDELKKYKESQPYLDGDTLENIKVLQKNINSTPSDAGILKAQYIDDKPILMMGEKDSLLYYYDESSGTISEIPVYENQNSVTIDDLNTILSANKVKQGDIQSLINSINNPTTSFVQNTTQPDGLFSSISKFFTGGSPIITSSNSPLITTMPNSQAPVIPQYLLNSKSQNNGGGSQQSGDRRQYRNYSEQDNEQPSRNYSEQDNEQPSLHSSEQDSDARKYRNYSEQDIEQQRKYLQQYYNSLKESHNDDKHRDYVQQYYNSLKNYRNREQQGSSSAQQINSRYNPNPSYTFKSSIYSPLYRQNDTKHSSSLSKRQEQRLALLNSTYKHNLKPSTTKIESFTNSNSTNITEAELITNMKKNNENIENVAIAFVTIIILLFLLVIFNAIRNKSGLSK